MGTLRKIKRTMGQQNDITPIVFVPEKFDINKLSVTSCIVITDVEIYAKIKEGVDARMKGQK